MADFNPQCGETSRKRKRKRKRPVGKGKGRDEAGDEVGRDEAGNPSPRIECLEMDKMTVDEQNVFTNLLSDLSKGNLRIVKDYYSPRFWSQLLIVYHERMSHLNRPFKQRTWLDMISMGQDVQYQYNKERAANWAAGSQINSLLEGIFGRCQSCNNRIPIFPTTLQQGRVTTYTSASQAKNAGSGHGSSSGGGNPGFSSFGGGNPGFSGFGGGNVGNPGFSNVGNPGFSNGGESSSSSLPQDIIHLLVDLLQKDYLRYDQWMNLRKAFTKWTVENHIVLFTLLRNPEIPFAKKVEYLRKESEELL